MATVGDGAGEDGADVGETGEGMAHPVSAHGGMAHGGMARVTMRGLGAPALTVLLAALLAGCTGGAGELSPTGGTGASAPPPLTTPLVDASTRRALGSDPDGALDRLAAGASSGTLLARSTDDRVCIFANGRNGWNRAAC